MKASEHVSRQGLRVRSLQKVMLPAPSAGYDAAATLRLQYPGVCSLQDYLIPCAAAAIAAVVWLA